MLSFDNPQDLDLVIDAMRSIDPRHDYLQQILLPALLRGDWDELDEMVVYQDDKVTILFGYDEWSFRNSAYKGKGITNLHFRIDSYGAPNVIEFTQHKRHLINQIKCVALANMWFSAKHIELSSISNKVNVLRINSIQLIIRGIKSFEDLDLKSLETLVADGCFDLSKNQAFKGLNALPSLKGLLPFDVHFSPLTYKMFNAVSSQGEGTVVIPPRLYFATVTAYSDDVVKAYGVRDEIENAVEKMLTFYRYEVMQSLRRIRNGNRYSPNRTYKTSWLQFTSALVNEGVALVDNGQDPRWMKVFLAQKPRVVVNNKRLNHFSVHIGGTCYGWSDFRRYLITLSAKASWLCLALSGMRVDELYKISPIYGSQKITFDRYGQESELGKETLFFFSTRQSKITSNSQTKDDTFVTTGVGWKAFHVLNAIHTPFRLRLAENERHRMFASLQNIYYFSSLTKHGVVSAITKNINKVHLDLILTPEDMGYLQVSDPTQTAFMQGDKFCFTLHQTRRSLAYYLIGYELCSFSALKQQLSHLSMAMTRWYARNAYSFETLYSEIKRERITQKAEIYARIYKKLANGERIAGGKGQAMGIEISREGESYFESGISKRKLSVDYWKEQLTHGKAHLHAIAPAMYCTNVQCSMRINVDLSECVDCEYDYIEDAAYAECSRMDAMRNIEFLKENSELNSSSATKYYMQIKAAERIMDGLGFAHEKYKFAKQISDLVIDVTTKG